MTKDERIAQLEAQIADRDSLILDMVSRLRGRGPTDDLIVNRAAVILCASTRVLARLEGFVDDHYVGSDLWSASGDLMVSQDDSFYTRPAIILILSREEASHDEG